MACASSDAAYCLPLSWPTKYDPDIQRSVRRWWPAGPEWRWWKAQLIQESQLNPNAQSPVGAQGLAQFMPATWEQINRELALADVSRRDAGRSIEAGAYYMGKLKAGWRSPRPEMDRHYLAAASYNAGIGSIIKAQRKCGGPAGYDAIMQCLPLITGKYSAETIGYVIRIRKIHGKLFEIL